MMNILIVLPYSGSQFGGGLAVLNQKLTRALAEKHRVKLLTMQLPEQLSPRPQEHGSTEILVIRNEESARMVDAGGPKGEKDRDRLYQLINSKEVLLESTAVLRDRAGTAVEQPVIEAIGSGDFSPDIIIGHSRFSGPAAILLKENVFQDARVEYFLHSFPVEGSALTGYDAYEMEMDAAVAERKFAEEKEWMPRADVVVGMGPLIRAGAMLILEEAGTTTARVHEAIPGIELTHEPPVQYTGKDVPGLLFCGRASAPIKGLEDLLLAVRRLYDDNVPVHLDVLWWDEVRYGNVEPRPAEEQWAPGDEDEQGRKTTRVIDVSTAQQWVDGMLDLQGAVTILPKARSQAEVNAAYRDHDAVLMPSYIEHFGLVPFEAIGHGVPVLVNRVSGSGMFLGDERRFGRVGPLCVVDDFGGSMDDPRDFLVNVVPTAFDDRPAAWAEAIRELVRNLETRFAAAHDLRGMLLAYTYDDFAASVVSAADEKWDGMNTYQGAGGEVLELGG